VPDSFAPQTLDMALQAISSQISESVTPERIPLDAAGGRFLAHDVCSPQDVPAHPLSAMDGFAFSLSHLNKADTNKPLSLRVTGKSLAGRPFEGFADPAGCIRIFTGARVPEGFDAVIPQERVGQSTSGEQVEFSTEGISPMANIRQAGEDIAGGAVALAAGTRISPQAIALLASIGIAQVEVMRSLRVAVLSTGDEVADPGGPLPEGAIYDANRPLLMELIRAIGADPIDLGIVRDDADSLRHHLRHAASIADAVITSGGVSVGEADHTRAVMQSLGEIAFWKLAIKPGRPLAAGWIHNESGQRTPFFGLPGNPVAAFVTFQGIVGPCLQRLGGATPVKQPTVRARLARATKKTPGRTEFLRCKLTRDAQGDWRAEIAASQGAASIKSLVDADGLAVLPHDAGPLAEGAAIDVLLLK